MPSKGWFQILDNWDASVIEKDMDSLSSMGVNFIRFMPLWYLVQPEKDALFQFYSYLKPEQNIDIDSKFIEFYHQKNDKTEMIILLNYTYLVQETNIESKQTVRLKDMKTGALYGNGSSLIFKLKPAEVLFLEVKRLSYAHCVLSIFFLMIIRKVYSFKESYCCGD